ADDVAAAAIGDRDAFPGVAQIDEAGDVGPDIVPLDGVARPGRGIEQDAGTAVGGDDVPRRRTWSSHAVARSVRVDGDAVQAVAEGRSAGCLQADDVPGDDVSRRPGVGDVDASGGVAADDVPGTRGGAADRVA